MSDSDQPTSFEVPNLEEVAALFPTYEVHRLIACGGMGAVFHATQRSLDRPVAIKILPREFSQDEEFRVGFEAEAKAMAKLNHPNLIGVYDFGEVDGMLYIVMEYVEGSSLYEAADGQAVEQTAALNIVIETCHGLAHAHQAQILHRDIKPSNILLDVNLSPKVGDFGLARALENQIQDGEQIFGTPGYTAPEVIEPPYTFDHRADIFSVGVMLHELLTGITPDGEAAASSQIRVTHPKLAAIIRRTVNPDPEKRYDSANDLAADLEKIASKPANPLLNRAASEAAAKPYTPPRPVKKKSGGGTLFVALLFLLIAAGAYYFLKPSAPKTPSDQGQEVVANAGNANAENEPPAGEITLGNTSADDGEPAGDDDLTQDTTTAVVEEPLDPRYDVEGFFENAKRVMQERVAPYQKILDEQLKANTLAYQNGLAKIFSRFDPEARGYAQAALTKSLGKWEKNHYRLPAEPAPQLMIYPEVFDSYPAALDRQDQLQKRLHEKIDEQAPFYISGIEKRIADLKLQDDPDAVTLLEREIARVKQDPAYFRSLFTK